ncbi:sushi, von Willebrand factor type A, EGF and pentraxin domain-containing protein 1-like isoform X2 [Ptychodera flava]|uniref:sushi, von Willebrand factor type A, EGF and pentraxin domain-containing protein 1-like isoform X2 n=1 Tax=Ptychodera flava TaxID=63121 RepID=UPI00396A067A
MLVRKIAALCVLGLVSVVQSQMTTVGQDVCPRKPEAISTLGRDCNKQCSSDSNCSGNKRCLCDDVCGFSCVNPNARCPALESPTNGRMEASQGSNRVFGTVMTYFCDDGFKLSGSGNSEIHCQGNRQWSDTPPTCVLDAACGLPEDVENARHDGSKNSYDVGERIMYSCNSGYFRRGLNVRRCMDNGQWTSVLFECIAKSCGNPGDISNGRRIGSVFTFPNRVYYECDTGYELTGRPYRACQTNQEWSGSAPVCRPVTCPRQVEPDNGNMFGSTFTYGAQVRFGCGEGYKLIGSEFRTCQEDGTWSGDSASCREIYCGPPEPIWNGYGDSTTYRFQSIIVFECNQGSILEGSRSTYCQEDETWSSPTPKCWSQCVVGSPPRNGRFSYLRQGRSVQHGTTLRIRCNTGYEISNEEPTACYNGTWPNIPTCDPIPCQRLPEPSHGSTNQDRYGEIIPHNTVVRYDCDRGYYLHGTEEKRCWFGNWSPRSSSSCRPHLCGVDNYFNHGSVQFLDENGNRIYNPQNANLVQGTQRKLICNTGYTLIGDDFNICDVGQWTDNNTVCRPDPCGSVPDANGIYENVQYSSNIDTNRLYSHGTYADVTCVQGRILIDNDSGRLRCHLGNWIPNGEQCIEEPCQLPALPDNAYYISSTYQQTIPSRGYIGYRCNAGYEINGNEYVQCRKGQLDDLPQCIPEACQGISRASHLIVNYNADTRLGRYPHETVATFGCSSQSYELSGSEEVRCLFGSWSNEVPTCVPASCQVPLDVRQDHITINPDHPKISHGSSVTYSCNNGYEIQGRRLSTSLTISCSYGNWRNNFPNCVPATCQLHADVQYDNLRRNYLDSGECISFHCDDSDQVLDPAGGRVCCQFGSFEPNSPRCLNAPCVLPRIELPLILTDSNLANTNQVEEDTLVEFMCADGYRPTNGDTKHKCIDGQWRRFPLSYPATEARLPVCQQDECEIPDQPVNGHVIIGWSDGHQVAIFSCDSGFDLVHEPNRRECLNGQWLGRPLPGCTATSEGSISDDGEKTCVKPPVLENGHISVNDQPYSENNAVVNFPEGTTLRFTCFSSHRLQGHSETSVCQDGSWTSVFPTCVDRRSCGCPEATENIVIYSNSKQISGCSSRIFPPGSVIKQRCSDIGKFFLTETSATTSLDRVCYNTAWTPTAAMCQRSLGEITWEGDSPREVTADGRLVVYPLPDTIFYIDCRSQHYSTRYLRWKKGSESKGSYSTRNGYMRLRFRPPKIGQSGIYTCTYGRSHLHSITVQMQEVQCPPIPRPMHGHITSERHPLRQNDDPYILGDRVSFSCSYGYQIQGVSSVTCTYTGQWSDQIPTCRDDRQCGIDFCEEWEICVEGNGGKWCTCRPASHCQDENQHVCGSDNKTYSSLCRLNAIRCSRGSDLYKISDGRCPNENACESHFCDDAMEECFINTEGEPSCRCKDDCDSEINLVCGTDGNVYNSLCHLNVQRCETKRQLEVDDTEESCTRREEEPCQRSCRPDSLSVACERAVDGENFVLIGNLTHVEYEHDRTLYLFSIKSAIPINGREILNGTVEEVQGPAAKRNGCLCPQVGNQGTLYVVFGVVEPDANIQLKLESHNYVAVLNREEFIHLTTECSALFRA